jgi:DNA repair exonuclease SbcCD ATPase subunit
MLLNNFLYNRSVIKNDYLKNLSDFNKLVPKTTIYSNTENPYENKEYVEEIKQIKLNGGQEINDELDELDELDDLKKTNKKLEEQNENLKEKSSELEDQMEDLEEQTQELKEITNDLKETSDKIEEKNEKIKKKEKLIEEKDKKLEEKDKDSKSLSKIKEALVYIGDKVGAGDDNDDNDDMYEHKGKEVILDNISKEGGSTDDKDVKNIVVSFF